MKEKIFQTAAKLIANKKISDDFFQFTLLSPQVALKAKPGQFVQIKISDSDVPLLRRPFGIHRVKGKTFEILCEIVGQGTEMLAQKKPGESLDIIGPLGNGFDYGSLNRQPSAVILVAGGMGVAPLVFLAEKLIKFKVLVLIGAKNKRQALCESEFKKLGCEVKIATDDGSAGFKGYVSDLLKHLLTTYDLRLTTIYACGPRLMLKEISAISCARNIPAQISLEEHLACGIGACLGCVVNTRTGFQRVCKEGPVFSTTEIIWEEQRKE